jgi:hypothetical protein
MAGATAVFLVSTTGMAVGREPFATWYYSFAWWSYILFTDAWLALKNQPTVLLHRPNPTRPMVLSVIIWVSFELYNFRLGNWHYIELPPELPIRWMGYAIAYATVLPGIFVTWNLLKALFPIASSRGRSLPSSLPTILFWGGLIAGIAPWLWPRYFFPFVWLGPTAVAAAVNYRLGGEGILVELEQRGPAALYRLVGAGAICGLFWELWNFWAKSKWVYDISFFDWLHLFEMPLAGFLGFLPFALECHELYWVGDKALKRLESRPAPRGFVWLALAAYVVAVFWGIDRFTVLTFQK